MFIQVLIIILFSLFPISPLPWLVLMVILILIALLTLNLLLFLFFYSYIRHLIISSSFVLTPPCLCPPSPLLPSLFAIRWQGPDCHSPWDGSEQKSKAKGQLIPVVTQHSPPCLVPSARVRGHPLILTSSTAHHCPLSPETECPLITHFCNIWLSGAWL